MLQPDNYCIWPNPICATLGMAVSAFASWQLKLASGASDHHYFPTKARAWRRRWQGVTGTGSLSLWTEGLGICCALSRSLGSARHDMGTGRIGRFRSETNQEDVMDQIEKAKRFSELHVKGT